MYLFEILNKNIFLSPEGCGTYLLSYLKGGWAVFGLVIVFIVCFFIGYHYAGLIERKKKKMRTEAKKVYVSEMGCSEYEFLLDLLTKLELDSVVSIENENDAKMIQLILEGLETK